jgi:hypothetical protein
VNRYTNFKICRDILKIDIEFAEFASLSSLSHAFPKAAQMEFPIGQMMIELHLFSANGITSGQFLTWYVPLQTPNPSDYQGQNEQKSN